MTEAWTQFMRIRTATHLDRDAIRGIHLAAFAEEERDTVSALAINLLQEDSTPPTLSLVAENDGRIVGHIAFSPVKIGTNNNLRGYILAPLAVEPEYQNQRVGSKLIEDGRQRLERQGVHLLFVYGDPGYYGRYGFSAEEAAMYTTPYPLQYPFGWQALILNKGSTPESAVTISCVSTLSDPQLW